MRQRTAPILVLAGCTLLTAGSTDGFPGGVPGGATRTPLRIAVRFDPARSAQPLDGRRLHMISSDSSAEPRFQIGDGPDAQPVFGIDVEAWRPGTDAVFTDTVFGFPLRSLADWFRVIPGVASDETRSNG